MTIKSFIYLDCRGPEGIVQCPCGHIFDYDACTEDGFTQVRSTIFPNKIVLALNCPNCGLVEVIEGFK